MSKETQNSDRIFGLDLVRAMAILLVVFSHLAYLIDSYNPFLISINGVFGFFGVEMFFVLSGFLIGTILLKQFLSNSFSKEDVFRFLKRRWFRTLPNYYLVLILNLIIAFSFGYKLEEGWKYFLFLQNLTTYTITFFNESWSLTVEEWAYVFSPMVLFFGWKIFNKNKRLGFLVLTLVSIVFFHVLRYFNFLEAKFSDTIITDMDIWNTNVKAIAIFRIDSILFGFLVAWLCFFYETTMKKYSVHFFIIAAHLFFLQFVVLNVLGFDIIAAPVYFNVFYFTLTSFTVALLLPVFVFWKNSTVLNKPITFISKISYSIYLLHYSIIGFLFKRIVWQLNIEMHWALTIIIYLEITFLCSYLLYRFYEKPILSLRNSEKLNNL